jgi:hypothetical protein
MSIEKIICETKKEYEDNLFRLEKEGWELKILSKDYAKFENNFPTIMEPTSYMRSFPEPDYTEVYYKPKQEE